MKTTVKSDIEQSLENNFRPLMVKAFSGYLPKGDEPSGVELYEKVKKSALEDIEQIVDDHTRDLNEELVDFALEVVWQYGYKIGDGVYATGGMSVVELAFSILRQNNMLDEDGNYNVHTASV